MAFNVKLMPVKVLSTEWDDIFGSPNEGTDDVVALGIRYAADNGAKIINMSLGRIGSLRMRGQSQSGRLRAGRRSRHQVRGRQGLLRGDCGRQ